MHVIIAVPLPCWRRRHCSKRCAAQTPLISGFVWLGNSAATALEWNCNLCITSLTLLMNVYHSIERNWKGKLFVEQIAGWETDALWSI